MAPVSTARRRGQGHCGTIRSLDYPLPTALTQHVQGDAVLISARLPVRPPLCWKLNHKQMAAKHRHEPAQGDTGGQRRRKK